MNDIEIDFSMYSGVPVIEPKIWSNNGNKYKSCFLLFNIIMTFNANSYSKGVIKMSPRFSIHDIKSIDDFDIDYSMFGIYNLTKNP